MNEWKDMYSSHLPIIFNIYKFLMDRNDFLTLLLCHRQLSYVLSYMGHRSVLLGLNTGYLEDPQETNWITDTKNTVLSGLLSVSVEANTAIDNSKLEISSVERHWRFSSCVVIIPGQLSLDVNRALSLGLEKGHLQDQEQQVVDCVKKKKKFHLCWVVVWP